MNDGGAAVEFKSKRKHAGAKSHTLQYNQKYKHIVPQLFDVLHQIKEETASPGKKILTKWHVWKKWHRSFKRYDIISKKIF